MTSGNVFRLYTQKWRLVNWFFFFSLSLPLPVSSALRRYWWGSLDVMRKSGGDTIKDRERERQKKWYERKREGGRTIIGSSDKTWRLSPIRRQGVGRSPSPSLPRIDCCSIVPRPHLSSSAQWHITQKRNNVKKKRGRQRYDSPSIELSLHWIYFLMYQREHITIRNQRPSPPVPSSRCVRREKSEKSWPLCYGQVLRWTQELHNRSGCSSFFLFIEIRKSKCHNDKKIHIFSLEKKKHFKNSGNKEEGEKKSGQKQKCVRSGTNG